ncbi:MAG: hypothetical protein Ta2B_02430 [Termitinemataceae bacterium]|nr:MAG: hypothetical protein Ta2B_02430 [Termitinemataceae bacterium]
MKMFYSEALKVLYLGAKDRYKCGLVTKEKLQEKKEAYTVDRPFLDFRHYATDPPLLDLSRFLPHNKKRTATTAQAV